MKTTDFINENFVADAAEAHQDHEVQMARADCYNAAKYAIELHKLLKHISEQEGLEGWVSEKITLANDYLRTVTEYLRYEQQAGSHSSDMPEFNIGSATQTLDAVLGESVMPAMQEGTFTWYLKAHGRLLSPSTSDIPYTFKSKEEAIEFAKQKYKTNWQNIVPTTYDVANSLENQPDKGWNEKSLTPVAEEEPEPKRKPAVVKTNKPIGSRVADIGPGGKEYNVKTDKAWDDQHKEKKDVAEGKADPTGSWVVYNGSKVKRFKTREGAKAYAEKNGGKVASSEHYHDKIQKQSVAETAGGMGAASVATSMGGGNGFVNGGPGTISRPKMKKKK